jgi:hypothetical protein
VTQGDRRIRCGKHRGRRPADDGRTADHGDACTAKRRRRRHAQNFQNGSGGCRVDGRLADREQALIEWMSAVDILGRIDRFDEALLVEPLGKRPLEHDAVDGRFVDDAMDDRKCARGVGGRADRHDLDLDARIGADPACGLRIQQARAISFDDHDDALGRDSARVQRVRALFDALPDSERDGAAFEPDGRHYAPLSSRAFTFPNTTSESTFT